MLGLFVWGWELPVGSSELTDEDRLRVALVLGCRVSFMSSNVSPSIIVGCWVSSLSLNGSCASDVFLGRGILGACRATS